VAEPGCLRDRVGEYLRQRAARHHLDADADSDRDRPVGVENVSLSGGKVVQLKIEIVNVFNRVQLRGNQMNTTQGNSAFGTIVSQGGFMRLTQVMFRYSW
jgi:hypothetical protein